MSEARKPISKRERGAAARALLVVNRRRGVDSPAWLRELADHWPGRPASDGTPGHLTA